MIVWIASYPRSGNNLFLTALQRAYGVGHRSLYEQGSRPGPEVLDSLRQADETVFVKAHEPATREPTRDDSPAVYLVRDGRDALVSFAHLSQEQGGERFANRTFREALEALIRQRRGFGPWSENVRSWRERPSPTSIVRFEELIADPARVVGEAVESLGLSLPDRVGDVPSFDQMHRTHPTLVRRGQVGSWRDEMPPDLHDLFWEIHGEEMRALGYR